MKNLRKNERLRYIRERAIRNYFKENNYGSSEGPNAFELNYNRYLLYKMFDYFYFNTNGREFNYEKFKVALVQNKKAIDYLLKTIDYKYEVGFEDSEFEDERIQGELSYINDRWYCYHRLLLLQKLVEKWE
jgi:hypothetical protein